MLPMPCVPQTSFSDVASERERTWERLLRPTVYQQKPFSGTYIHQRRYCQGTPIPNNLARLDITFATVDGMYLPAKLALAGQLDSLVDGNSPVFAPHYSTINLRVEVSGLFVIPRLPLIPFPRLQWPGYSGWSGQVGATPCR